MKFFSRLTSLFLFFLTISLVALAPSAESRALSKRADGADVLAVLTTLKQKTDTILPQLNTLLNSGNATQANVRPHIQDLASALGTGVVSLAGLAHPITFDPAGPSKDDILQFAGSLLSDVGQTLTLVILVLSNSLSVAVFMVTAILQDLSGLPLRRWF